MLDVKDSVRRLAWTVEHHFLHIQNQHPFMRAWAVQFELAYTDFRTIQMALQLAGESFHPLLAEFSQAYEAVYDYEYEFAANGLDGFNAKYGSQIDDYQQKEMALLKVIAKIKAYQPQ